MSLPMSVAFGATYTTDEEAYKYTSMALEEGYRIINTCAAYENERGMGRALAGVPRDSLTIVSLDCNTKRSSTDASHFSGYSATMSQVYETLENLNVGYIDYFLINWPIPRYMESVWQQLNSDSWRAMEECVKKRIIKHIGVSNFLPYHLEALQKTASLPIEITQLELHPNFQQRETVSYCRRCGMEIMAWSPLFKGRSVKIPTIIQLANQYGKTPAQIILRWHIQKNIIPVVYSSNRERMRSNINVFDFEICEKDMVLIDSLESGEHIEVFSYARQQESIREVKLTKYDGG